MANDKKINSKPQILKAPNKTVPTQDGWSKDSSRERVENNNGLFVRETVGAAQRSKPTPPPEKTDKK